MKKNEFFRVVNDCLPMGYRDIRTYEDLLRLLSSLYASSACHERDNNLFVLADDFRTSFLYIDNYLSEHCE